MRHSIVLATLDNEDITIHYASPDAEVLVDGTSIESNVPVELYNLEREDIRKMGRGTFMALLKAEVDVRRNGDKREGLIGG